MAMRSQNIKCHQDFNVTFYTYEFHTWQFQLILQLLDIMAIMSSVKINFIIILSICSTFRGSLSFMFPNYKFVCISHLPSHPHWFNTIIIQYLMKSKNDKVPQYIIFSVLLLLLLRIKIMFLALCSKTNSPGITISNNQELNSIMK